MRQDSLFIRRGEKTAASVSGEPQKVMPVVARDSLHLAEPDGARLALQDRERFEQFVIDNMIANAVELLGFKAAKLHNLGAPSAQIRHAIECALQLILS